VKGDPRIPEPLLSPVIDTHTHLDVHDRSLHGDVAPTPDELLVQAAQVGVTRVVQIGCDVASSKFSVDFAATHPQVAAGIALHPNDAARIYDRHGEAAFERAWGDIAMLAEHPAVNAVGETGLDYYRTGPDLHAIQAESFRRHIELAKEYDKTLVIHDREAHEDVISVLRKAGAPERVVFHCFSGDVAMARTCADEGWYMSFAGVVTYKSAQELRDALAVVPEELVLVETDAPYLTPVPNRGKPNASALMPDTVRAMADVREVDEVHMCQTLWRNAERAFLAW
jgi:TatD DNase family protein